MVDEADPDHDRCREVLQRPELDLVIPVLVIAEVSYFINAQLSGRVEAMFLRSLESFNVVAPAPEDWLRIGDLVEQYADFPLGGVDASVIALAERMNTDIVITLDHRHFRAVRPKHCATFQLLPE